MKNLFIITILLFPLLFTGCATRGFPESIVNFDKVNTCLYRGGQPNNLGVQHLKELGVKTVINLRMPDDVLKEEELECRINSIIYTNVPLKGFSAPTDDQVNHILNIIEKLPNPIFIHCQHGCDRTGTIIACYRIKYGYNNKQALKEAEQYGLSEFEIGMRNYIRNFKKK
jgi:protein tyrosine/serine phosphatase